MGQAEALAPWGGGHFPRTIQAASACCDSLGEKDTLSNVRGFSYGHQDAED